MTASNIERFDEIAGRAFAHLYEKFPLPVSVYPGELIGQDLVIAPDTGFFTDETHFCNACLYWLVDAGYITGKRKPLGLENAVLTAKGLETLKAIPDSLNAPWASLGERMVQAAKTEGGNALRSLTNQALGVGLQLLAR